MVQRRKKRKYVRTNRKPRYSARRVSRKIQVRRQKAALAAVIMILLLAVIFVVISRKAPLQENQEEEYYINADCEAYRPQVEETAARYGMSSYVDLLMALMMQESSGQGNDVMQSSEGKYNTKYPQKPNGITDPEYSIECGVQELKYALELTKCQGADDRKGIEYALQAYNFGADAYVSLVEEKQEDGWSVETAEEFAKMASGGKKRSQDDPYYEAAGPWDYGDQYYPEHVLRYYQVFQEN